MNQIDESFAEVIESSLHGFVAQSWEWDYAPAFGALVMIREAERVIFAIVYEVKTGSNDTVRTPFAYRKTEEELKRDQPHIFEFLKTTFSCVVVGYRQGASMRYMSAPKPVKIHTFISLASPELAKIFFASPDYLYVLCAQHDSIGNMDELLLALIMHATQNKYIDAKSLRVFMQTYVLLVGNEYRRIKLFAQRVQHSIEQ